jgi:hypothetical protein
MDLPDNLAIRIGEEGYTGSYYNIALNLTRDDGRFTFCSTYDCPKDECAVPEQMGSGALFIFLEDIQFLLYSESFHNEDAPSITHANLFFLKLLYHFYFKLYAFDIAVFIIYQNYRLKFVKLALASLSPSTSLASYSIPTYT